MTAGQRGLSDRQFCGRLCLSLISLLLLSGAVPNSFLSAWFGPPPPDLTLLRGHFIDRFFVWDSGWYDSIAKHGYAWSGSDGAAQNVAFFPLWPLILRAIYHLGLPPTASRIGVVLVAATLACASIFAFQRFARRLLAEPAARWATAFYAFNPAAHFMFQSYPVGLLNLLAILALTDLLDRRFWRAALLSGVATAGAPLLVFLSFTVFAAVVGESWPGLSPRQPWRRQGQAWLRLAGLAGLSLAGILLFMLWLDWRFGNPLAFLGAQDAWVATLPLADRLWVFIRQELVLPDFVRALQLARQARHFAESGAKADLAKAVENVLAFMGLAVSLIGTLAAFSRRPRLIALYAWWVIAAYIWLISTNLGGYAALRLIYVAVPANLGLAILTHRHPRYAAAGLALSAAALAWEALLTTAGYWVI